MGIRTMEHGVKRRPYVHESPTKRSNTHRTKQQSPATSINTLGRFSQLKMRFAFFPLFLCFVTSINALHFYLDANQQRCFIEELPTDTVVEGERQSLISANPCIYLEIGHYRALEWSEQQQKYVDNEDLGIIVEVQVRHLRCFPGCRSDARQQTGRTFRSCCRKDHRPSGRQIHIHICRSRRPLHLSLDELHFLV